MPEATFVPGSAFRVSVDAEDYSAQVTGGGTTRTPNTSRIRTLTSAVYPVSDVEDTADVDWLFDENPGLYGALYAKAGTGETMDVEIIGGASKWTGLGVTCTNVAQPFTAEDGATVASASFAGTFTFGPVTP